MSKIDSRIIRTKQLLREALLFLVEEKEYNDITVTDITNRAEIGYRTFYRHYENIDRLMLDLLMVRLKEFQSIMLPFGDLSTAYANGKILFKNVEKNKSLYKTIYRRQISENLTTFFINQSINNSKRISDLHQKAPLFLNMILTQLIDSVFSLIHWWIDNECPYSIDEMSEIYSNMIIEPALKILKKDL